jgi:hypothetical protein
VRVLTDSNSHAQGGIRTRINPSRNADSNGESEAIAAPWLLRSVALPWPQGTDCNRVTVATSPSHNPFEGVEVHDLEGES